MSVQIPVAHVEMYRDNVIMLAQQKGSRLLRTVRQDGNIVGRTVYYDRLGATSATRIQTRHADTPLTDSAHSRRRAELQDYDWADLIDNIDEIRTIHEWSSKYAQAGSWAVGRSMDDVIIEAAYGSVYEGQSGGTTTAFDTANRQIPAGGTGMTIAKILAARELLEEADVDPDLPRYIILTANEVTDLLNTTEVKSSDYNTVKALAQGAINTFCGFEFVRSQRLGLVGSEQNCFAYTQQAIGCSLGNGLSVSIDTRHDKRNATQVYVTASLAATRIEDAQLVSILCA